MHIVCMLPRCSRGEASGCVECRRLGEHGCGQAAADPGPEEATHRGREGRSPRIPTWPGGDGPESMTARLQHEQGREGEKEEMRT